MNSIQVILHPDPAGGYWVEVPSLPGCVSHGRTRDEALENSCAALQECVRCYRAAGRVVPWSTAGATTETGAEVHALPAIWEEPWPDFGPEADDAGEGDDEPAPLADVFAEYGVDVGKRIG